MKNPWNSNDLSSDRAVLLALRADPEPVEVIGQRAGIAEDAARAMLDRLAQQSLAIEEDGGYELTGPLSWFGDFAAAIAHYAPRRLTAHIEGDGNSHLFLSDVRIKGSYKTGDPRNQTAAVFACGMVSPGVELQPAAGEPSCPFCKAVMP